MIEFKARSIVLLIGAVHGLVVAGILVSVRQNAVANRFLAALLVVFALRITPYIIGFAGFFDAYPWLSFAPWELSLAFGPLLYFYVRQLGTGRLPARWYLHFLPAIAQFSYYAIVFSWPLPVKNDWDARIHEPWIDPAELSLTLVSITAYLAASVRQYRSYQRWLIDNSSRRDDFHLDWVRNFLVGLGLTLLLWAGYTLTQWLITPLSYLQRFPMYVWLSVLVYYLGTEGWRHARLAFPRTDAPPHAATPGIESGAGGIPASHESTGAAPTIHRDWKKIAQRWLAALTAGEWWRDPDLSLVELARRLGTNTGHLSRALNEGLGESFSGLIGRLRVEGVKEKLRDLSDDRDILTIALDAGFSSKASFNRVFKGQTGQTPSEFRAQARRGGVGAASQNPNIARQEGI